MLTLSQDEREEIIFYGLIFIVTFLRVITSKIHACPPDFDCNSYIQMANSIAYDPNLLSHHAMRILPSLLAQGLHQMGISLADAFAILSRGTYILFGLLTFWMLRQHSIKPITAFSFSVLCLAVHHAMRIPLQNVYQLCDMMTYPIALLLIHFTMQKKSRWVFILTIAGLFTKQTLFGLGGLALGYCLLTTKRYENILWLGLATLIYWGLQSYYHAFAIVTQHLIPTADFFTVSHIVAIVSDSGILDLFIPLFPILLFYTKAMGRLLYRNGYIAIYIGVIVGQPLIAFHLTGNNFQRLALQGIWLFYLIAALACQSKPWKKGLDYPLALYSLAIYFTWGMPQRMVLMVIFTCVCLFYYGMTARAEKWEYSAR